MKAGVGAAQVKMQVRARARLGRVGVQMRGGVRVMARVSVRRVCG